jgi:ferrous iron transport protein A
MAELKKLSELKSGACAVIKSISDDAEMLKKRLLDMGCITGCEVKVIRIAPLGDPIDVFIKDYSLTLRKNEADKITVEVN